MRHCPSIGLGLGLSLRSSAGLPLWTPDELDLAFWGDTLDTSATNIVQSGGLVSQWSDKSGNGNHAVQSSGSLQPAFNSGRLQFNGTGKVFQVTNDPFKGMQNPCIVMLGRWDGSVTWGNTFVSYLGEGTVGWQVRQRGGNITDFGFTLRSVPAVSSTDASISSTNTDFFIGSTYRRDTDKRIIKHNGTQGYIANDTGFVDYSGTDGRSAIGGRYSANAFTSPAANLNGSIKAMIVLDNASDADVERLEGWMAWRYGEQGSLDASHPYKNAPPVSLWTPSEISPYFWTDPSDTDTITSSGGLVSNLQDKSGNNRDATQPTGSLQPATNSATVNGLNILEYATSYMSADTVASVLNGVNKQFTLFEIAQRNVGFSGSGWSLSVGDSNTNGNKMLNGYTGSGISRTLVNGSNGNAFVDNTLPVGAYVHSVVYDAATLESRFNGQAPDTAVKSAGTISANRFTIGSLGHSSYGQYFDGAIGEVLVFDRALTFVEIQLVEGYLAWKWRLQGLLPANHPYKNGAPTL